MIDLQNETVITLTEAPKTLPSRPSLATLFRWGSRGCRGVVLETVLLGGRRATSREALDRFFMAVTAAPARVPTGARTPKHDELAVGRAADQLGL
jgi:hypothetical protein